VPGQCLEEQFDRIKWWPAVSAHHLFLQIALLMMMFIIRSLVALALILSLLQYKPAPMYILDEIDAALDLSHTQNIGQLFRTRFKGSQFIVVSLKEGMFNNANVLFRARFRDGVSVVEVSKEQQA
jgi:structural maintenance of chromosome 2